MGYSIEYITNYQLLYLNFQHNNCLHYSVTQCCTPSPSFGQITILFIEFSHVSLFIYACTTVHSRMYHCSFTHVPLFIHACTTVHLRMYHCSFTHVPLFIHACTTVHSRMYHCSFTHVPLFIHACTTVH